MVGRTNVGGGGGGLQLKIVTGTARPSSASENTIWVNTTDDITSWVIRPSAPPVPTEGMLWLGSGWWTENEFNLSSKNGIYVQLTSAIQYVSGAWVEKEAAIYQNNTWTVFSALYHPLISNAFTQLFKDPATGTPTIEGGTVRDDGWYQYSNTVQWQYMTILKPFYIDGSKTKLIVNATHSGSTSNSYREVGLMSSATGSTFAASGSPSLRTTSTTTIDITSLTPGYYYFRSRVHGNATTGGTYTSSLLIHDIKIE